MSDNVTPSPGEPAKPAQQIPWVPKSVNETGLKLLRIRLKSLVCTATESETKPPSAVIVCPKCNGQYAVKSMVEGRFQATVSWYLNECELVISGTHVLTFSVKTPPFSEDDAKYYSETNSVILAYPYIRHIIDDLAVKCLGRNLMIPPLDVPQFVQERLKAAMENRLRVPTSEPPARVGDDEDA